MDINYSDWIGMKVFLITKTNRKYSGIVKVFDEQHVLIIDRFDEFVIVASDEISSMEVEK